MATTTSKRQRWRLPQVKFTRSAKEKNLRWGAMTEQKPRPWRSRLGNVSGGNVKCEQCSPPQWMDASVLTTHQKRKHGLEKAKPAGKAPITGGRQKTTPAKTTPKDPPKTLPGGGGTQSKTRTPKPKPRGRRWLPGGGGTQSTTRQHRYRGGDDIGGGKEKKTNGGTMSAGANTRPIENAHTNPAMVGGADVVQAFNAWAARMPANYEAARREAETMGECFRGIADAFRRRAENMVAELHIGPDTVEPYEEAAGKASAVGDDIMEVATRIEAKYREEIEMVNNPNTPNLNFLGDGEK